MRKITFIIAIAERASTVILRMSGSKPMVSCRAIHAGPSSAAVHDFQVSKVPRSPPSVQESRKSQDYMHLRSDMSS